MGCAYVLGHGCDAAAEERLPATRQVLNDATECENGNRGYGSIHLAR